jgi:transglutaminase-like putative cysteine protease
MTLGAAILASLLVASPPSGRPPIGPLERYEPRMYDFTFEVAVSTVHQRDALDRQYYHLADAPIVMPVIFQGTYSRVEHDSLAARLWLGSREDTTLSQRTRLDEGQPHHTHLAVIPIVEFRGQSLRWQLSYRVQSWSSRLNDAQAATIAWPKEWPSEVDDGLKPQQYIESNDPVFAQAVEHVSQGQLRLVPPYLAAKDLVRYCINEIKVSGNGTHRGALGVLHGLEIVGARRAVADHRGGPHDLVCVCVAMLRAAGIPARPVIGVYKDDRDRSTFVSWAEFYLPNAGWIPFDPAEMRGKGVRHLGVREAWPEFGTMKDLNRRLPLAYHFMPPVSVESPQNPAVWGWDPRPGRDPSSKQQIRLTIVSRGRAPEDPQ